MQQSVTNDYSAIGDSFLMSTIALCKINDFDYFNGQIFNLGGLINVMPLMFSKLKQTRNEVI